MAVLQHWDGKLDNQQMKGLLTAGQMKLRSIWNFCKIIVAPYLVKTVCQLPITACQLPVFGVIFFSANGQRIQRVTNVQQSFKMERNFALFAWWRIRLGATLNAMVLFDETNWNISIFLTFPGFTFEDMSLRSWLGWVFCGAISWTTLLEVVVVLSWAAAANCKDIAESPGLFSCTLSGTSIRQGEVFRSRILVGNALS